jgi:hypothetical protein
MLVFNVIFFRDLDRKYLRPCVMKYTVYQVDALTSTLFKGNPAGVVVNAEAFIY